MKTISQQWSLSFQIKWAAFRHIHSLLRTAGTNMRVQSFWCRVNCIVQFPRVAVTSRCLTIPPPPPVFSHLPHTRPQPLISPVLTAPSTHWKRVDLQAWAHLIIFLLSDFQRRLQVSDKMYVFFFFFGNNGCFDTQFSDLHSEYLIFMISRIGLWALTSSWANVNTFLLSGFPPCVQFDFHFKNVWETEPPSLNTV